MSFASSLFGDDKKGKKNSSSSSFNSSNSTTVSPSPNAPDVSGYQAGSTVINNKPDTSVPKQNNPYLYGGTTKEDLSNVGFTGVGGTSSEDRRKTSGYDPSKNEGGTITETTSEGVTTTTNALGDNPTTTFVPAGDNNDSGDNNKEEESNIFQDLFGDQNVDNLPDDKASPMTAEEKRKAILQFKSSVGYDTLSAMNKTKADEIIAKLSAGEYFGSDFASMQGTNKTGNELLAANNKSVSDISEKDALALFKIATQNKGASTAREAGFSQTAEALLKSYVETLSPEQKSAFEAEVRKIADQNFNDPRNELINIYTQPALLRRLTGLSTLNENQLAYDRLVNEARQDRESRRDTQTGQVNAATSTQMGTDTTEQGEASGYGTLIGSDTATSDFIDTDGDGIDDRYQKGPNQPYEGPPRDPNTKGETDATNPNVTTNPNSFGNTALSGVFNLIPVKNRFTGKIEYIQAPVRNVNTGGRNFGSISI